MIAPDHECWWTSHHTTELSWRDGHIAGFGICLPALAHSARLLGVKLEHAPSSDDEHTLDLRIGHVRGSLHDRCMASFDAANSELAGALIAGMLQHHAAWLEREHLPEGLAEYLSRVFRGGTTVRVASRASPGVVVVKTYPVGESWLGRLTTPRRRFR